MGLCTYLPARGGAFKIGCVSFDVAADSYLRFMGKSGPRFPPRLPGTATEASAAAAATAATIAAGARMARIASAKGSPAATSVVWAPVSRPGRRQEFR